MGLLDRLRGRTDAVHSTQPGPAPSIAEVANEFDSKQRSEARRSISAIREELDLLERVLDRQEEEGIAR